MRKTRKTKHLINSLLEIGYPPEHQVIQALKKNVAVDLNQVDEYGFTPLRWAVQKQSLTAVRRLQEFNQHTSDYDRAFIAMAEGRKGALDALTLPTSEELVQCFKSIYPIRINSDFEIYYGMTHLFKKAFLEGKTDEPHQNLYKTKYTILPIVKQIIQNINNKEVKPFERNHFFTEVQKEMQQRLPANLYKEIQVFFTEAVTYLDSRPYPSSIKSEGLIAQSSERPISPLPIFWGNYSEENLALYFAYLNEALKDFKSPVSFELKTNLYPILINYHQGKWFFNDIFFLNEGQKVYNNDEIAEVIKNKLSGAPYVFSTEVFLKPDTSDQEVIVFRKAMTNLMSTPKWHTIHQIGVEQLSNMVFSDSCLAIAAENGCLAELESYLKILKRSPEVINYKSNGRYFIVY